MSIGAKFLNNDNSTGDHRGRRRTMIVLSLFAIPEATVRVGEIGKRT